MNKWKSGALAPRKAVAMRPALAAEEATHAFVARHALKTQFLVRLMVLAPAWNEKDPNCI
jgi:hypothetical protein